MEQLKQMTVIIFYFYLQSDSPVLEEGLAGIGLKHCLRRETGLACFFVHKNDSFKLYEKEMLKLVFARKKLVK